VLIDATLLAPQSDSEWWDYARAWPTGKGKARLADFVDDPSDLKRKRQERQFSHEEMLAMKPGGSRPEAK
jgi:hypothetical protein